MISTINLKDRNEVINFFDNLNFDQNHFTNRDDICTPMQCVFKMIDYIPKEIWNKKNLKILDPCCGNGNFAAGLMFYTNLDNIYMNDINEKRIENCKKILNPLHLKQYNIFSIEFQLDQEFNTQYDLIIANPPYSGGGNKNQSLSNKFIEQSIDLLNDGGYLCFITPNNWMSFNHSNTTLKKLLSLGSFVVIDNDAKKYFNGVGSSFTIFVWQKKAENLTTVFNNFLIKDVQKNIDIPKNLNFIPLYISQNILNFVSKIMMEQENGITYRCDLHNFTKRDLLSDNQDDEFKYKTIHTARKTRYAKIKQDIFDKYVIIIPLSTYYVPYIETKTNVTQSVCYLSFDNKSSAQKMLEVLKNDIYKTIIHLTRYGNFNNIMVIKHLNLNLDSINLNDEENKQIKELVKKIKY